MPNISAATRILGDDLLAQLRTAQRPLTTAQLRQHAPAVPVAGARAALAPVHEQVYRVLCGLERQRLVVRSKAEGRQVSWSYLPNTADHEIASLTAAFTESETTQPAQREGLARTTEHLIAGARTARTIAIGGDTGGAATALSQVLIDCAELLTAATGIPASSPITGGTRA